MTSRNPSHSDVRLCYYNTRDQQAGGVTESKAKSIFRAAIQRRGAFNMFMGFGICLLGLIITGATYALAIGGKFIVAYGAIAVGGIQLLIGLAQYVFSPPGAKEPPPPFVESDLSSSGINVVLHAMAAVSASTGKVERADAELIAALMSRLTDKEYFVDRIEQRIAEYVGRPELFLRYLPNIAEQISKDLEKLIIRAAHVAAANRNPADTARMEYFYKLGQKMSLGRDEIKKILEEGAKAESRR